MSFEIRGLRIKIGFLFVWVLAILLCFDFDGRIKLAVLFSLVHETGHLAAILLLRQRPKQVSFGLFGMTIIRDNDISENYRHQIITSLAGPAVNAVMFLVFYTYCTVSGNTAYLDCAGINAVMALFNLMPVFSLDGGRALEAVLNLRYDSVKSERILKAVSFVFLLILDSLGILILIKSGYNFTLLIIAVYLTVMLFLKC